MPDWGFKSAPPVTFASSSVETWGMGGSGYSVKLMGEIDDVWADTFLQARDAQKDRGQFYLDRTRGVVAFSTQAGDDLQEILAELGALLDRTNRRAGRQAPAGPLNPPPAEGEARRSTRPRAPGVAEVIRRKEPFRRTLEDSRGSSRVAASMMVEFAAGVPVGRDSAATGMTRDLSGSGMFILTNRLPSVGDRLSLVVHLTPQNQIDLTGEVVRVLDKEEARRRELRPGFAARVSDSSGKYSRLLERTAKT